MMNRRMMKTIGLAACAAALLTTAYTGGSKAQADPTFARSFPITTNETLVYADQLPTVSHLTSAQQAFITGHYVGSQKMPLSSTNVFRGLNSNFLMLHYHLGIWQSAVDYIVDGENWGNDYDIVTQHEDWFMHRFDPATGQVSATEANRVYAYDDHKYLMNITNEGYYQYFKNKLITQAQAGDYDGVFLDSFTTSVVGWYLQNYPEYAGTTAVTDTYPELGTGVSWKEAAETFIGRLTEDLNDEGIYVLPNLGNFITGWDSTDYTIPNGGMTEGAFSFGNALNDWKLGMNGHLKLISNDRVDMAQEYLPDQWSYERRLYYLGNYLLLRGKYTYLYYFSDQDQLDYYPEYDLDLGAPLTSAGSNIDNLASGDLYIRDFQNGKVIVNPPEHSTVNYSVPTDASYKQVVLHGTGAVATDGTISGWLEFMPVSGTVAVAPKTSLILVKDEQLNSANTSQFASALDSYTASGALSADTAETVHDKFNQSQHQLEKGSKNKAAKFLDDIVKELNHGNGVAAGKAKYTLNAYANALIKAYTDPAGK